MAAPKVQLKKRKGKKRSTYFIEFTLNGKRRRLAAGTNKKNA